MNNLKFQGQLEKKMFDPVNQKEWTETTYWWSEFQDNDWVKAVKGLEQVGKQMILDAYDSYKEGEVYPTCVNGKLTGWTLNGETEMLTKIDIEDEAFNTTHSCF